MPGDLIVVFERVNNGAGTAFTVPSWMTKLHDAAAPGGGSIDRVCIAYGFAPDGVTSFNFTHFSAKRTAIIWRFRNAGVPEIGTVGTTTGTLSPSGGAADYVWITGVSDEGETTSGISGWYPTDYTIGRNGGTMGGSGSAATNTRSVGAAKLANAASSDPVWNAIEGGGVCAAFVLAAPFLDTSIWPYLNREANSKRLSKLMAH